MHVLCTSCVPIIENILCHFFFFFARELDTVLYTNLVNRMLWCTNNFQECILMMAESPEDCVIFLDSENVTDSGKRTVNDGKLGKGDNFLLM